MIKVGLNPYGIAFSLGMQGMGTPRANPRPLTVEQYLELVQDIGSTGIELDAGYYSRLDAARQATVRQAVQVSGWWVVLARFFRPADNYGPTIEMARALGATLIRVSLTTVLCGDRALPAHKWAEVLPTIRPELTKVARQLADSGMRIAIENHQDFTGAELMDFATSCGENVGIAMDMANPLAVGENPVDFARLVAPRIMHLHLKNYWPQWTDQGYRLFRSPIGDGVVPFQAIFAEFAGKDITAGLELGALDNRHIRLLTDEWWQHYPERSARQLAKGLLAARVARMAESEDHRTPWEAQAAPERIMAYELDQLWRSVENIAGWGMLKPRKDPAEVRRTLASQLR
jgi:sugar phosphate isomerase/epimerase